MQGGLQSILWLDTEFDMPQTGSGKLAASEGVENVQKSSLADIITKKWICLKLVSAIF